MNDIAIQLKTLKLYSHLAHNQVSGATFFSDHEFLGGLYEKADDFYDSVVERMIGLGMQPNITKINVAGVIKLKDLPSIVPDNKSYFVNILMLTQALYVTLDATCKLPETTEGTRQLLGGIADELEVLNYKMKQRVK